MPSMPTLQPRTRMERFSLLLAAAVVGLGSLTLAGWWLPLDDLLQPLGAFVPLEINAAIAFCILGLALIALQVRQPQLAWTALVPVVLGGLTLAEHGWKHDLQIDQLFGVH